MRIVRRAGTTVTDFEKINEPVRKLVIERSKQQAGKTKSIVEYALSDPDFIVAFAASAMDKTFKKPSQSITQMRVDWFTAREKLGNAIWAELCAEIERTQPKILEGFRNKHREWRWKVHPYSICAATDENVVSQNCDKIEKNIKAIQSRIDRARNDNQKRAAQRQMGAINQAFNGRWFATFTQKRPVAMPKFDKQVLSFDMDEIAARIIKHLFHEELAITGDPRHTISNDRKQEPWGRIESATRTIAKSVSGHKQPVPPIHPWDKKELTVYFGDAVSHHDVAAEIVRKVKENEDDYDKNKPYINASFFAAILADHCKNLKFGPNDEFSTHCDRKALLALHHRIRTFYKNFSETKKFKASAKLSKNSPKRAPGAGQRLISERLPKSRGELLNLIGKQDTNKYVSALIKRGKVLHYTRLVEKHQANLNNNPAGHTEMSELKRDGTISWLLNDEGQSFMKRVEGLSRSFRHAVVQAERTASVWVRPPPKDSDTCKDLQSDVFSKNAANHIASEPLNDEKFRNMVQLIFGDEVKEYFGGPDEVRRDVSVAALEIGTAFRNRGFHFLNRSDLVSVIIDPTLITAKKGENEDAAIFQARESLRKGTEKTIRKLYARDGKRRVGRLDQELQTLQVGHCFEAEQVDTLRYYLKDDPPDSDLSLPRFNRIISRNENVRDFITNKEGDLRLNFPASPNTRDQEKFNGARCKYGVMKLLYEKKFRSWADNKGRDGDTVKKWFNEVIEFTTSRAVELNDKTRKQSGSADGDATPEENRDQQIAQKISHVSSRAEDFLTWKGDLQTTFADWDRVLITETREQATYEDDPAAARKKSEWVENCKCDLLAKAFAEFLAETGFDWLWKLDEERNYESKQFEFKDETAKPSDAEIDEVDQWRANFYFFLHFVPVEGAGHLLHQLRKASVLETRVGGNREFQKPDPSPGSRDDIHDVKDVLTLYLDMKDDKFTGVRSEGPMSEVKILFEQPADFDTEFGTDKDDHLKENMRRGLRQILRFGDLPFVQHLLAGGEQIPRECCVTLNALEDSANGQSEIDAAHERRESIHKKYVKKSSYVSDQDRDEYKKALKTISDHRNLVGQVRLNNHLKAYQLSMNVISRLMSYTARWERDFLFVAYALTEQYGVYDKFAETMINGERRTTPELVRHNNITDKLWKALHQRVGAPTHDDADILDSANQKIIDRYFGRTQADIFNRFTHLAMMTASKKTVPAQNGYPAEEKTVFPDFNLTKDVYRVRDLMRYDRKQCNSVPKSIIDMLRREGLNLEWQMKVRTQGARVVHRLEDAKIGTDDIRHMKTLKGPKIYESRHSDAFVNMVCNAFRATPKRRPNVHKGSAKHKPHRSKRGPHGGHRKNSSGHPAHSQRR